MNNHGQTKSGSRGAETPGDQIARSISRFAGSWPFVILHLVWFGSWIVFNFDVDLLTMIVSLEAIFLATFILMVQNRQAKRDEERDEADYRTDLESEKEIREVKEILHEIRDHIRSKR